MIEAEQVRTWEAGRPTLGPLEWLRAALSNLSALFGSWKSDGDEEDLVSGADPEVVAALQFLASIIPDE